MLKLIYKKSKVMRFLHFIITYVIFVYFSYYLMTFIF